MKRKYVSVAFCIFVCSVFSAAVSAHAAHADSCLRPAVCVEGSTGSGRATLTSGTVIPGARAEVSAPVKSTTRTQVSPRSKIIFPDCRELGAYRGCVAARPAQAAPVTQTSVWNPITLADIADFVPVSSALSTQPSGWSIVGKHTNVMVSAAAHIVDGQLFGKPAQVRFTPVGVSWNYGDGTQQRTSTTGATWARLSLTEFMPTATSHVFTSSAEVVLFAVVSYRAEYRYLSSEWVGIEGTVSSEASPATLRVLNAHTVLTSQDCGSSSTAAGC